MAKSAPKKKSTAELLQELGVKNAPIDVSSILATPIGVPQGYKATRPEVLPAPGYRSHGYEPGDRTRATLVAPQYIEGDEYKNASLPPEQIQAIQSQLVKAGVLTDGFHYGAWDAATAAAYKQVLALANQTGGSASDALQQLLNSPVAQQGTKGPTKLVSLTSPTDIEAVVKSVAPDVIGRNLSSGEVAQIVSGFHALETQADTGVYNANVAGSGTVTQAPNLQAYVQQQTRAMHPDEAVATDRATVANNFLKALNSAPPDTAKY